MCNYYIRTVLEFTVDPLPSFYIPPPLLKNMSFLLSDWSSFVSHLGSTHLSFSA